MSFINKIGCSSTNFVEYRISHFLTLSSNITKRLKSHSYEDKVFKRSAITNELVSIEATHYLQKQVQMVRLCGLKSLTQIFYGLKELTRNIRFCTWAMDGHSLYHLDQMGKAGSYQNQTNGDFYISTTASLIPMS